MRRRRTARQTREKWTSGPTAPIAKALNSQGAMAAFMPRADRMVELLGLGPGKRYVDIGCGTGAFANLLAGRAGVDDPPICVDLSPLQEPVDAVVWPEQLPFASDSVDVLTCFHFLRRFDDDVVHGFAEELARVLAPNGRALIVEFAPVRNQWLEKLHQKVVSPGCAEVDLRGWGRLAALLTECGFGGIDLVELGPYVLPPIPRISALVSFGPEKPEFMRPGYVDPFVGAESAPAD